MNTIIWYMLGGQMVGILVGCVIVFFGVRWLTTREREAEQCRTRSRPPVE